MLDELYDLSVHCALNHPYLLPFVFALLGLCIGSYLNVVIYRLPLGLSTGKPRRSFCPHCKQLLPWYLNIPVLSWLYLRGRSACCNRPISPRYLLVELATALLFALIAYHFSWESILVQALLCVWVAFALAIFCIDMEQMIVLPSLCVGMALIGVLVSALSPSMLSDSYMDNASYSTLYSICSALGAFAMMKAIGLLGRAAFGKKSENFDTATPWRMCGSEDKNDIIFSINGKDYLWSELFMEASHRIVLHQVQLTLKGKYQEYERIIFSADAIYLPHQEKLMLEDYDEASGTCTSWMSMKEAMGSGDAWITLGIAALCGATGFGVALVVGSFLGIFWAMIARIARGVPMPFGPCLLGGAFLYLMGWLTPLWEWYSSFLN